MDLSLLLKKYRIKNELTQEQLAKKMYVSHQTISKWETGINVPSIDNLLMLSDIYNISLDELIRGSSYFRKPFLVGKKFSFSFFIIISFVWLLISLLFTGFGYQPQWLFWALFILGEINVLCTVIKDYWIITVKGIVLCKYPDSYLKKLKKLFLILIKKETSEQFISYKEIRSVELIYTKKNRMSPFDINPDSFYIKLTDSEMKGNNLSISSKFIKFLPQAFSYIEKRNVPVYDENKLIPAIMEGTDLYTYMNNK